MEVFSRYFRRLVTGNAPQIFPNISRAVENPGNYPLLVGEIRKTVYDREQAHRIAESIDTADGDLFKDFDLSTFMNHFQMDPFEKCILALAFESATREDLRRKAGSILSNNIEALLAIISDPNNPAHHGDMPLPVLTDFVTQLLSGRSSSVDDSIKVNLAYCVRMRFKKQMTAVPSSLEAVLQSTGTTRGSAGSSSSIGSDSRNAFVQAIRRTGPENTARLDSCKEMLRTGSNLRITEAHIAEGFMVILNRPDWPQYDFDNLVEALDANRRRELDWNEVAAGFDRDGFTIKPDQFQQLLLAFEGVARQHPTFDIQRLWGGRWKNAETQLSFVTSLAANSSVDVSGIPRFQASFSMEELSDSPEKIKTAARALLKHPLSSKDATIALYMLAFETPDELVARDARRVFETIMRSDLDLLLCGLFSAPQPWNDTLQAVIGSLFHDALNKSRTTNSVSLRVLWKRDRQWVATRLVEAHSQDPMKLPVLFECAVEQQWLDDLLNILNGFGLDLAAQAHRRELLDVEQWAQQSIQRRGPEFAVALSTFLTIKAEDEVRTQRGEQEQPRTVSLAIRTVNALLEVLEQVMPDADKDKLVVVQRECIQAYPRLINYGEGFDDVIEANSENSHAMPSSADQQMQEHYRRMYSNELDVKSIVEALTRYKRSRDPAEQDLFACMIHGLFDEYSCFREYPLDALATTAVLFGGIVNYKLVSGIPLRVALGMILEAVRNYGPETSMFKFGLQALVHCFPRLPEWPGFCAQLLEVRTLVGTEAYKQAEDVVKSHGTTTATSHLRRAAQNGTHDGALLNGNGHNGASGDYAPFASVNVELAPHPEDFEDPNEEVQDRVLFVLNNISEQNMEVKLRDLLSALQKRHHQWFAHYVVEERAKMQPNFQQLYLDMLNSIDDKSLWTEVLRQTYVSCIKLLNAESTMAKSNERTLLKNLAGWLGSITIARDKPIKFKNISFKDLLIEAYDTQRLIVAIPFTCKVLLQAAKSSVFRPPNPWLMDIIQMLVELYNFAELKLNLKFEIEVLCKELELDHNTIEPSTGIRDRPRIEDDVREVGESAEPFDDYPSALTGNRAARQEMFSPAAISASLPALGPLLVVPSIPGISQARLKSAIESAIQRAIQEIISQVVERSVTIAAIASAQLIQKDFAMEPSEERVKHSALTMVKELSGSLAQVTCKEPLRITMTNLIRSSLMHALPNEHASLEGAILMCVNDNLDMACGMFARAAEDRCVPEIEEQLEAQLALRRRHQAERPNEPFVDPGLKSWAFYLPDPYRLKPGGLNREQMAIYENFGRTPLVSSRTAETARQTSGEMQHDAFQPGPMPPVTSVTPHPPGQVPMRSQSAANSIPSHELNGLADPKSLLDRVQSMMVELKAAVQESASQHFADLPASSNVLDLFNQIIELTMMSPHREAITLRVAQSICNSLYTQTEQPLEVETFVQLLQRFCQLSPATEKEVIMWLMNQEDARMFNVPVTVALLKSGLLDLEHLDITLTRAIQSRKPVGTEAIEFLSSLIDDILLGDNPMALRSDLTGSVEAVSAWVVEQPTNQAGVRLLQKLRDSGMPVVSDSTALRETADFRDQMEYIFSEWVQLCQNPATTEKHFIAFISQLHQKRIMSNQNDSSFFFRSCIDMCVAAYEDVPRDLAGYSSNPFVAVDALAKLIMLLMKYQNSDDGDAGLAKAEYLASVLSLVILVLNHHHVMRGVGFNQKVFYRLFSSMLYEFLAMDRASATEKQHVLLAFSDALLTLQPTYFPGFTFGWLALLSHRGFMPRILNLPNQAGWESYMKLMEAILRYVGEQLKGEIISDTGKKLNNGLLRVLLVMHHDFPEFLADNHFWFCEVIPPHCTQIRNLILSACPSSIPELPDPFTAGLRVDRLPEMQVAPAIIGDTETAVRQSIIQSDVDAALERGPTDENVAAIINAFELSEERQNTGSSASNNVDTLLINSLVLYIGSRGITAKDSTAEQPFDPSSPHVKLFSRLVHETKPEARYFLLSAIANQLRYPNSHTHYFYHVLLFLFGSSQSDPRNLDIPQQISRVMLERLIVHRPHPWGLIVALLELLKNQKYYFWDLPFIKAAPEVERLFGGFFSHINNSPR